MLLNKEIFGSKVHGIMQFFCMYRILVQIWHDAAESCMPCILGKIDQIPTELNDLALKILALPFQLVRNRHLSGP